MKTASIFKKMAAIVAIVGAGLLAAPLEQAEAQGPSGSLPTAKFVDVTGCFDDDPTSFNFTWEITTDYWPLGAYPSWSISSRCLYQGGYVVITLNRLIGWSSRLQRWIYSTSDWVEIWVWMGDDDLDPYAWAEDSEGYRYDVDLYFDGYHFSGPGLYSP